MDSLITAAARALAVGDPLACLNFVALRDDAPALALRGIALAQLGDLAPAKQLLRRAARAFGPKEAVARARCVVAEAEIALVSRDLKGLERSLAAARATLEARGDTVNAAHAWHLEVRRLLLIGRVDAAAGALAEIDGDALPAPWQAAHELAVAGVALRRLRTRDARAALARAARAARSSGIAALHAEVERAALVLATPAARATVRGTQRTLFLADVEALLSSGTLVVDACRHAVRDASTLVPLARRPVLFALARALAEGWPGAVPRAALIARAFRGKRADESYRARLRVEIGRLRKVLQPLAAVTATADGFKLVSKHAREVAVLVPPVDDDNAAVLALLADGEAWSTSALALALDTSQRTVQRALDELAATGRAQSFGSGPARRWTTPPLLGIATTLLLPTPLPSD